MKGPELVRFIAILVGGILMLNAVVWGVILLVVRGRFGDRPKDLEPAEKPDRAIDKTPGYYLHTMNTAGGRFTGWGLLARGNGTLYIGTGGIYFRRHVSGSTIFIPFSCIVSIGVGPSGTVRTGRLPMLHIKWRREPYELVSLT